MDVLDEYGFTPEQAWLGTLVAGIVALAGGAVVFTEQVYYGFLWRYFWGPVEADAAGVRCVAYLRESGEVVANPDAGCAAVENAYVAEPGYTIVSTVGYMVVLVFMLGGLYLLLRRFDLRPYAQFFFALVPFMLFGGALRVVEDSFVAAQRAGQTPAIDFPASAALISPFIYFTVFFVALAAFLVAKWFERQDYTDSYTTPLGALGGAVLVGTVGYLTYLAVTVDYVFWYPLVTVVTVGLATVLSVAAYYGLDRYYPEVNAGTGTMGLVVIWATPSTASRTSSPPIGPVPSASPARATPRNTSSIDSSST